jgi:hypothetical protein
MLWTLFFILVAMWVVGLMVGNVLGGYIHLLLVVAAAVLFYQLVSRHRTV